MEIRKENKMGTMPVGPLLVRMALPIVASMLVQALYNIVDSIFVAQISENALTAVSLAFPVQNLIIAVAVGTGVGINALLSRKLGERSYDDANKTAENGLLLGFISGLVFAVAGMLFSRGFFTIFTRDAEIIEMGTSYLTICTVFSFGVCMQIAVERIMQSTGNTIYYMITQLVGALTNIILDPILIFGLLGFPKLGVAGAAIATVTGQLLGLTVGLLLNHHFNKEVTLDFRGFRPSGRIIGEIYKVGIPSIIMQSIATVMTMGVNLILAAFSATAVSVFGIYFKLQSFVFMPVFGLTNGLIPIAAFNYGARKRERIISVVKHALVYAVGIMVIGTLLFQLLTPQLLSMFQASPEMLRIGVPALRIISISFACAGVGIVLSTVFQALGNGMLSLIISVARQLLVILPLAFLLSRAFGLGGVWFAFPASEIVAMVMAVLMFRHIHRTQIMPLGDPPAEQIPS